MTDEKYGERIAGLEAVLREFKEQMQTGHKVLFGKMDGLSDAITDLKINGCVVGKQHTADIRELKERPGKSLAAFATISGIISSVVGAIVWLIIHVGLK